MGHVARNNRPWKVPPIGEAMVIVRGPDAYISPAWYATKREHGRVVPTWNYVTAHVHGQLVIHDDPAWVEAQRPARSATATRRREPSRGPSTTRREPYVAGQLRAIVGVEIRINRIEAKFKLSQNRSTADVDGAIEGLGRRGRAVRPAAGRGDAGTARDALTATGRRGPRRSRRPNPNIHVNGKVLLAFRV